MPFVTSTQLDRRLAALGNRFAPEDQAKIMDMIYARVPIPTIDEQREVKLENVMANERVWSALRTSTRSRRKAKSN